MAIIIAKNDTTGELEIADLGISIDASPGERNLTDEFSLDEIDSSEQLLTYVSNGDIIINDGVDDLSISNGIEHLRIITLWEETNISQVVFEFGRDRDGQHDQWLRGATNSPSNLVGSRMIQSSKVVAMAVQCRNIGNANFYLRKNGVNSNLATVSLSGVSGNQDTTLNVNLAQGDWIGVYMEVTSGDIDRPHVTIYVV